MRNLSYLKSVLAGSAAAMALASGAWADQYNIPSGDLKTALDAYATQTGVELLYPADAIRGSRTRGARGELAADVALSHILAGTGFITRRESGAIAVVHDETHDIPLDQTTPVKVADAAAGIESVVVTSSKIKGDIQTVPIAITALSQEQLTSRQIAGGPDLVKEVPNLTFSKTNFTGYNIQIRGIGTQAISVTTDPAVAVAFNDIPFIRNHFFEQEFYDVSQVEVLRGPQGTLYGRNATAGVVNVISAKPTDQFEAMASADIGNYHNRRFEGMINVPLVDDRLDIRVAGEWTKRDGYSFNELTNSPIDGRDLWSSRVTIGWKPAENVQTYLVWEHFQEADDRLRSGKQLCKTDPGPSEIGGVPVDQTGNNFFYGAVSAYLSQGCLPASLYAPESFEVPNAHALPYVAAGSIGRIVWDGGIDDPTMQGDPYLNATQSQNLRVIESSLTPSYKAKNDTVEFNADWNVTPALTVTSQTGFNQDFLWSTEDYNRFAARPNFFLQPDLADDQVSKLGPVVTTLITPNPAGVGVCATNGCLGGIPAETSCTGSPTTNQCLPFGTFCDPQLGCSTSLVAEDLSDEHAWQLSQEFRLASNFSGPLNFSVGGNYLHYETEENYYVFVNTLTALAAAPFFQGAPFLPPWNPGVSDNHQCLTFAAGGRGYVYPGTTQLGGLLECGYVDPNPISHLDNKGHNYFLSQNPYLLNSYAAFGEVYYNLTSDLKLVGGLRWTDDKKRFTDIPSEILAPGYGYPISAIVNQQWEKLTGRAVANWTPKLDFTDQTLIYTSYSHGYKAGGANPPGAVLLQDNINGERGISSTNPIHPLTFKPEFIEAYELGTKNTLLDGALTLNGDVFYYDYKDYQISEIVDRTAINLNFNATVKGAELETSWEPAPGLKFSFAGGYEDTRIANGQNAVDLIDRTAGNPDWVVVKPFITQASNCILPTSVMTFGAAGALQDFDLCVDAYQAHIDPVTGHAYVASPVDSSGNPILDPLGRPYPGFDPTQPAINNGQGFAKPLGGNQLPNAPHFTTSLSADYTMPVSEDWAATLHSDFYWQSQSFARVFDDRPYDKVRGYSTTNLALILTSANGWQVMGYLKNVFNVTAITGDFLNSDDSGLTTNVFLTDPRLFGVRVTKNF